MKTLLNYLRLLSLAVSGMLLLSIVLASIPEFTNGIIFGKLSWFHFAILPLAGSVLLMEFTHRKSRFIFSLPDVLLVLLFGTVLITYNIELNPGPDRLLFISQLITLWFMLRAVLQTHPELKMFFFSIIMFTGILISAWTIGHSYGNEEFSYPLLKELELNFEAIPLSGYLAIILPISLNFTLRLSNCTKWAWWEPQTTLYYLSISCFIFILLALPVAENHAAWIAAMVSCIWVFRLRFKKRNYNKIVYRNHFKVLVFSATFLFLFIAGLPGLLSLVKNGSYDQRILVWNITTRIILNHPLKGVGVGGFPVAYAEAQANYFASGQASETDKQLACSPEHAFNEYLQIGAENGMLGLILFCLWEGFCFYYGLKHHQIGSVGAILSLSVFAMYSYPLQLPSFSILFIFLSAVCVNSPRFSQEASQKSFPYIGVIAAVTACLLYYYQQENYLEYKEWKTDQLKQATRTYLRLQKPTDNQMSQQQRAEVYQLLMDETSKENLQKTR